VNNELGEIWKEAVVVLSYYPSIYMEGLKKTTEKSSVGLAGFQVEDQSESSAYEPGVHHI
jgi:hypothetical protein